MHISHPTHTHPVHFDIICFIFLSSTYLHVSLCLCLPESTHMKKREEVEKRHTMKKIPSNVILHFVLLFCMFCFCFSFYLKITNGIFHFVHIFLHNIFLSRVYPACLLVIFVFVFSLFSFSVFK